MIYSLINDLPADKSFNFEIIIIVFVIITCFKKISLIS